MSEDIINHIYEQDDEAGAEEKKDMSKFNVNLTFDIEDMKIFKPETKSIKNHLMKLVIKHLINEGLVQQNDFDNIERKLVAGLKNR